MMYLKMVIKIEKHNNNSMKVVGFVLFRLAYSTERPRNILSQTIKGLFGLFICKRQQKLV